MTIALTQFGDRTSHLSGVRAIMRQLATVVEGVYQPSNLTTQEGRTA
ncbi:MAG: hypothetical protein ACFE0J_10380 [Elainellaceae cyanobacterium]